MLRSTLVPLASLTLLTSAVAAPPSLGTNASLHGTRVFAPTSAWNTPIDQLPVDPQSAQLLSTLGDAPFHPDFGTTYHGAPLGIPYVVVPGNQPRVPVLFEYASESDQDMYPIPASPAIEGMVGGKVPDNDDGDHHLIMLDVENKKLYELYGLQFKDGWWHAGSGAIFDLFGDTQRPLGWTSADAAGLPIFPGLVRYDEVVEQGKVEHALRFTAKKTRHGFVAPARHFASRDGNTSLPPMGMRIRLKASVDVNAYPAKLRPLLVAMKRYGLILADNGGPLFVSGSPDPRWNDDELNQLKKLHVHDFEVVRMGNVNAP